MTERIFSGGYILLLLYCLVSAVSRAASHIIVGMLVLCSLVVWIISFKEKSEQYSWLKVAVEKGVIYFFIGCLISIVASENLLASISALARVVYNFIPLLFVDFFVRTQQQLERLCVMLACSVLIGGGIAAWQNFQGISRAKGMLGIMDLGGVLGILVPLIGGLAFKAFRNDDKKMTLFYSAALFVGIAGMVANGTRINWVGVFFSFFCFFIYQLPTLSWKQRLVILGATSGALFVISMNEQIMARFSSIFTIYGNISNRQRIEMWQYGLDVFLHHPWIGVGFGVLPGVVFDSVYNFDHIATDGLYGHVHSVYIQLLAETGIIGAVSYFIFLFRYIGQPFWKQLSREQYWPQMLALITISFMMHGLADYVLGIGTVVYAFSVATGICIKGMRRE